MIELNEKPPHQCHDFIWDIPSSFNFAEDVVDYWAEKNDNLCLIWENSNGEKKQFTYSEMSTLTKRLAWSFQESGIKKGDRVLVVLPRIPEWQIAVVAALRIGAVPIPCIEMLTADEIAYRVDHAETKAIVCRAQHIENINDGLKNIDLRFSVGSQEGWVNINDCLDQTKEAQAVPIDAEDPVLLYYTSGSTGQPKGVLHSARGLYSWRFSARHWLDVKPKDCIWCTADTGWSKAGTSVLFGPWSEGGTSFFYDGPFGPKERLRLLSDNKVTIYCAPATELSRVVQEDVSAYDISTLRRTVSSGEAMSPTIADKWQKASGLTVAEAYGQTETLMTALTLTNLDVRVGSMGVSAPGSELSIINDSGDELPIGEVGHIALKLPNPQMMIGYWKEPERISDAIIKRKECEWFVTGDLGKKDADGYFWYEGRSDDVINSAGYRIGPTEVENAILKHESVLDCAAVASPDASRGEVVKAFIVLREDVTPSEKLTSEIQNFVKKVASPYKYLRRIEYRPSLPKGPPGKILRRSLRDEEFDRLKDEK